MSGNSPEAVRPRWPWWAPPLILAVAVAAVYSNALNGPFFLDDHDNIVGNLAIRRLWPLSAAIDPPPVDNTFTTRPFINLTMCADYALWGLDVRGYHLTSILFHLAASLALFGLLGLALRSAGREEGEARLLALAAALIWAVHPLATSAVNYLSQRPELGVGFFLFLTLYCLHRAVVPSSPRLTPAAGPMNGPEEGAGLGVKAALPGRFWLLAAFFSCLLGMGSKESMAAAPILAAVYDRIFLSSSWKDVLRKRGLFYLLLAATWIWPASRQLAFSPQVPEQGFASGTYWRYPLTQAWGIIRMISLSLVPSPLILDYGPDPADQLLNRTWVPLLMMCLMVLAMLWALMRYPRAGFVGLCFFALLAPSSTLIPIVGQPVAEHRMYAPLAALVVLWTLGVYEALPLLIRKPEEAQRRRLFIGLAIAWALALGLSGHHRNVIYRDAVRLWSDTVAKRPGNGRAWHNLGVAFNGAERHEEALLAYANAERMLQRWHKMRKASQSALILTLVNLDRLPDAFGLLEQARMREPTEPIFLFTLGVAHLHNNEPAAARVHLEKALALNPGAEPRYRIELARACFEEGDAAVANKHLRRVWGAKPSRAYAYDDLLPFYARTWDSGEKPRALHYFRKLAEREPENVAVLNNIAWILAVSERSPAPSGEAVDLALKAVELGGEENPRLLDTLAAAYANAGDFTEALSRAEKARLIAREQGWKDLVRRLDKRIKQYRKEKPWRENFIS